MWQGDDRQMSKSLKKYHYLTDINALEPLSNTLIAPNEVPKSSTGSSETQQPDLEEENQRLHRVLEEFIAAAQENRTAHQRFRRFELRVLSCHGLDALMNMLVEGIKEQFELDSSSLWLYDSDGSLSELLDSQNVKIDGKRLKVLNEYQKISAIYPKCVIQLKDHVDENLQNLLFPDQVRTHSLSMLPLIRNGLLMGSLHLGSRVRGRFTPTKGTDFLEHLAYICALCIENSVNQQHLLRLSLIDMLTHVHNRRAFNSGLRKEFSRAERLKQALSCLFIDIDYFKMVNDTYGHQIGDVALKEVARISREQLRATDMIARYGGEEFTVLLPNTNHKVALQIAERIRQAVKTAPIIDGENVLRVTISVGVSTWNQFGDYRKNQSKTEHKLLSTADEALYLAKQHGRDQVRYLPIK